MKPFKNRLQAGQELAQALSNLDLTDACIIALPRGGVPIAEPIVDLLNLPWDIAVVKKIGAPMHPEFAIGAIAEDEIPVWNQTALATMGISDSDLVRMTHQVLDKIRHKAEQWKAARHPLSLKGKSVIIVDDGLATGLTMEAAINFVRKQHPSKIIVAVPVAPSDAVEHFAKIADKVIALKIPRDFMAVGQWYEDFTQVLDQQVTAALEASRKVNQLNKSEIHL